jgi:hypothetical protein
MEFSMLYSALAVVALSASSFISPFSRAFHVHPNLKANRITVTLRNQGRVFQDVAINRRDYTIMPHQWLHVSGPAGTTVIADSNHGDTHRGDTLVVLQQQLNNSSIDLK